MTTIAVSDIMAQMDNFSYEEKKTLAHAFRLSLKRRPRKIHLRHGNGKESVITNSLIGIFNNPDIKI